jgi:hypothetical protein
MENELYIHLKELKDNKKSNEKKKMPLSKIFDLKPEKESKPKKKKVPAKVNK